jgi:hypothetical protein
MAKTVGTKNRTVVNGAREAEDQLTAMIEKFTPQNQTCIRSVRKALRKRFPTATEMVYDNYNFFVIGYSPTSRPSDAIVSMTCDANGMGLCFTHGASLPDPKKILLGAGTQTRFIRLESAAVLARPEVEALITEAIARLKVPVPAKGHGELLIKSISAKQRPRRRAGE